jgi:hypothetical protein
MPEFSLSRVRHFPCVNFNAVLSLYSESAQNQVERIQPAEQILSLVVVEFYSMRSFAMDDIEWNSMSIAQETRCAG